LISPALHDPNVPGSPRLSLPGDGLIPFRLSRQEAGKLELSLRHRFRKGELKAAGCLWRKLRGGDLIDGQLIQILG